MGLTDSVVPSAFVRGAVWPKTEMVDVIVTTVAAARNDAQSDLRRSIKGCEGKIAVPMTCRAQLS